MINSSLKEAREQLEGQIKVEYELSAYVDGELITCAIEADVKGIRYAVEIAESRVAQKIQKMAELRAKWLPDEIIES